MGAYQVHYIYNNETLATSKIALLRINLADQKVYFVAVSDSSTTRNIACRRTSQKQVVVGPNGCSSPLNPAAAIQSSNCIENEVIVEQRRATFKQDWWLSKNDPRCKSKDPRLCIGPVRLALDNEVSFIPRLQPTAKQLLAARMIFVETLFGPFAMIRGVVQVPMIVPSINLVVINGSCGAFDQSYVPWPYDPYSRKISDVWMAFKGTVTSQKRILLKRQGGDSSVNFQIIMGDSAAAGGNYNYDYGSSIIQGASNGVLLITQNWIDLIDFGQAYAFYNYTSGDFVCAAYFTIEEPPNPYELEDLYPVTAANYSKNALPRVFYKTRGCNYVLGRVDVTGNLVYPDVLAGDKAGGDALFSSPQFPNLRYFVPSNAFLAFDLSCERRYPPNMTFADYGIDGIANVNYIPRINYVSELCNFKFVVPDLIGLDINPFEKWKQCSLKGGWLVESESYCAVGITTVSCLKPYVLFDNKCFYKFSPSTETRYAGPIDAANIKCSTLNDYGLPLIEADIYTDAWLRDEFIYIDQDLNNFALYRIPQFNSDKCTCYNTLTRTKITDCSCYDVETADGLPIFPICYYPYNTPELEPPYWDIQISLQTARVLIKGQDGPQPNGLPALCRCFDCNTGENCERKTCCLKDILQRNPADLSQVAQMFRKCYTNGRGACYNGQPRVCKCNYPYAPNAATLPSLPSLYQFIDTPCAFPAAVQRESLYFQIGTTFYPSLDPDDLIVCGGISQGIGITSNATNDGHCLCNYRTNVLTSERESAFAGMSCSCENPIIPYGGNTKNGLIVADLCNYRGTCCPFGQSVSNPIFGNVYDENCYDPITRDPLTGCVGDNGWGGESSTCPVPFDLALSKFKDIRTFGDVEYVYIDLGSVFFVQFIRIRVCSVPTSVQISNDPGADITLCTFNVTSSLYECPNTLAKRFVVLVGPNAFECYVQAYEDMFQFCGANNTVNPFSGTFFNIPTYRSNFINEAQQYTGVATFGCTNTDCKCNPDYNGKLCRTAVSSIRETIIEDEGVELRIYAQRFCGEEVLVPALDNPVRSRGFISDLTNECVCNSISNVDATGRIGRVREKFIGRSCQCFDVYNPDLKEVLECAGHGFCEDSSFEYGRCELDIENYVNDALFRPFVVVTDTSDDYIEFEFTEDSYFYGEYVYTTLSPTASPTTNPTSPTPKPTAPPTLRPLVVFALPGAVQGYTIGSRTSSTAQCLAGANAISLSCTATPMLVEYSYSSIDDFPSIYNFDPSDSMTSVTNNYIGTWSSAFTNPYTLTNSLSDAGAAVTDFWSGYRRNPSLLNCADWTSSVTIATRGDSFSTSWLPTDLYAGCGFSIIDVRRLCLCVSTAQDTNSPTSKPVTKHPTTKRPSSKSPSTAFPTIAPTTGTPTKSPTQNPTKKPTANPTSRKPTTNPTSNPTRNPTANIQSIILYDSGRVGNGNIGSRTTTTALCSAQATTYGLDCIFTPMLISYSYSLIQDMPTVYTFSPTVPLFSRTGTEVSTSWAQAMSESPTSITYTLYNAGVLPAFASPWWSGYAAYTTPGVTCVDWTSSSAVQRGDHGMTNYIDVAWISAYLGLGSDQDCSITSRSICMCIRDELPTTSPTKSPTPPTSKPTKTPSQNPTSNPTRNPTLKPTTAAPTKLPTSLPTKNPTRKPSKSPSNNPTRDPTHSPYISTYDLVLFYLNSGNGGIGDRATTDAMCAVGASGLGLSCHRTPMFISYTGDTLQNFPTKYTFTPSSTISSVDGTEIGVWSTAFSGSPSLTNSLCTAGVLCSGVFWSGYTSASRCVEWTTGSNSFTATVGNPNTAGATWIDAGAGVCGGSNARLCLCIPFTSRPTKAPTVKPTRLPTKNPVPTTGTPTVPSTLTPTRSPSKLTTQIILFDANSPSNGNMGNRATTTAICAARAITLGYLDCFATPMFINYFHQDLDTFPEQYDFNENVNVVGPGPGFVLLNAPWFILMGAVVNTLTSAGVISTYYYTGYSTSVFSLRNCLGWTSSSVSQFGQYGRWDQTGTGWIRFGTSQCNQVEQRLCICAR